MSERQAVIALAGVLQAHARRGARHELAPHRDDFATVTSVNPVEIDLHHGGDTLPEDVLYFDANCPPQSLAEGDVVLVIVIDNEHYVAGRGILGGSSRDQQASVDFTGAGLASSAAVDAVEAAVAALDTSVDSRLDALEAVRNGGARIAAGNPPVINGQSGGITSVTRQGAGITRVVFSFSVADTSHFWCNATIEDNSAATPSVSPVSASPATVDVYTWNAAAAALDRTFQLLWRA